MSVEEESRNLERHRRLWIDAGAGLAVAVIVAMALKTFVVAAVHVPSRSMEATLLPGDYVLVNKLGRSAEVVLLNPMLGLQPHVVHIPQVRRTHIGDVVLVRPPTSALLCMGKGDLLFIKRCIATGGDTVEFCPGGVTVNGRPLIFPETALARSDPGSAFPERDARRIVVPQGEVFLVGDNASESFDSRAWGSVPEEQVVGNAFVIYWSLGQRGMSGEDCSGKVAIRWERIGTLLR
jgi:signal peptidase I